MKKSHAKFLSVLLALVLVLSFGAFTAFAVEEEQTHAGECYAERIVDPCKHQYSVTPAVWYVSNGSLTHTEFFGSLFTCTLCGYSYYGDVVSSSTQSHTVGGSGAVGVCMYCGE